MADFYIEYGSGGSAAESYANLGAFPATGVENIIYIAEDSNYIYRWDGSAYVELSAAPASGANTFLSNLTSPTDIAVNLTPSTAQSDLLKIGANGRRWNQVVANYYTSLDNIALGTVINVNSGYVLKDNSVKINLGDGSIHTNISTLVLDATNRELHNSTANIKVKWSGDELLLNSFGTSNIIANPAVAFSLSNKPIISLADPTNAQDAATKNYVDTTTANTTLSNLVAPTAINASLLPALNDDINLGSSSLLYSNLYSFNLRTKSNMFYDGQTIDNTGLLYGQIRYDSTSTVQDQALASTNQLAIQARETASLGLFTMDQTGADNSKDIIISSGNVVGLGNTGSVTIRSGTTSGGIRGDIFINSGENIVFNGLANFSGRPIEGVGNPTNGTDVATKDYVDNLTVVKAKYRATVTTSSSPTQPLDYVTVVYDSHSAVTTGSAWKFTAPIAGVYNVTVAFADPSVATYLSLYLNGVMSDLMCTVTAVNTPDSGSTNIYLAAGDFIDIRANVSMSLNITALLGFNQISITRIGG